MLAAGGESVTLYHAGLSARERHAAMAAFLDGSARIVTATVAFGMGIDKPDVRWVLHVDPPASLDSYYQELGRAGRDEQDAYARLLFRPEDFGKARHLTVRSVAAAPWPTSQRLAGQELGGRAAAADRRHPPAVDRRRGLGGQRRGSPGGARSVAQALRASSAETVREHELERSRLDMMRRYAEHQHCRRSFLLTYFGQDYRGPCGHCDNDDPARPAQPTAAEPFAVGTRVLSGRWGEGTVQRYDGDQLTVLFDGRLPRPPCSRSCSTTTASGDLTASSG